MAFKGWPVEAVEFYEGLQVLASRGLARQAEGRGPGVACLQAARPLNAWLGRYFG
jgi:hypothetical protein